MDDLVIILYILNHFNFFLTKKILTCLNISLKKSRNLTPEHFKYFSLQTEKKTRLERFAIRPILISPPLQFNKENIVYGSYYFLGHKNQKSACSYCILLKMKFSNDSVLNYNINIR